MPPDESREALPDRPASALDCECRGQNPCPFHGLRGPIGPGTPHARMQATWERMHEHEAEVVRLTDWTPMSSLKTLEWAFVDAFAALRAENEALKEQVGEWMTKATDADALFDVEVTRLRQGLWDCATAAGMDTDGDAAPTALVAPDIVDLALSEVKALADSYGELLRSEAGHARRSLASDDLGHAKEGTDG